MAASTSFGDGDNIENGDEMQSLDGPRDAIPNAQQPPLPPPSPASTSDRIIKAFKDEIKSSIQNNVSQLVMTVTSEMYVYMTTTKFSAVYYISHVLSGLIMINAITLLGLIVLFRKKAFKTTDGQCPARTMEKARTLQKVYRVLSILLTALQVLFTMVTSVSIRQFMIEDPKNDTSTVTIEASTIGGYVVNTTSG